MKIWTPTKLNSAILVCLGLALLSGFKLWEEDLFWQIRAGQELWETGLFPVVDQWSFTVVGEPWQNHQWLWTLLLNRLVAVVGIDAMVLFRLGLVFVYFIFITLNLACSEGRLGVLPSSKESRGVLLLVLLLAFLALLNRVQLRSELLVLAALSAHRFLQHRWANSNEKSLLALDATLLLVIAQVHYGLLPLAAGFVLWGRGPHPTSPREWLTRFFLVALSFAATPYSGSGLAWIERHISYAQSAGIANPEHSPARLMSFEFFWILLTVGAWFRIFKTVRPREFWVSRGWSVILLLGTLWRDRLIGFLILASIRDVLNFLSAVELKTIKPEVPLRVRYLAAVLGGLIFWVGYSSRLNAGLHEFGLGLNEKRIPVAAIRWAREKGIKGPWFHTPAHGDALLGLYPEERVFWDTREMMYDKFARSVNESWNKHDLFQKVLEENKIQAALLPIETLEVHEGALIDHVESRFPADQWSLVYADDWTLIVVLRNGVNSHVASRFGIEILKTDVPPSSLIDGCNPQDIKRLEQASKSCFGREPKSSLCNLGLKVARELQGDSRPRELGADSEALADPRSPVGHLYRWEAQRSTDPHVRGRSPECVWSVLKPQKIK